MKVFGIWDNAFGWAGTCADNLGYMWGDMLVEGEDKPLFECLNENATALNNGGYTYDLWARPALGYYSSETWTIPCC